MPETNYINNKKEDEIDLISLGRTIWLKRKLIIFIMICFLLTGIFVAAFSQKEFTASSTFIPQTSEASQGGGSLGGLASLAGINLGSMGRSSEISPALYPRFISSVTFRKALIQAPIVFEESSSPISYAQYFEEVAQPGLMSYFTKYTIGLPGLIMKSIRGTTESTSTSTSVKDGDLIRLTNTEVAHFNRLNKQISIESNEKDGLVILSVTMPEPLMAAQMAQFAQELLQKEVIAYKISNAREQLKFTQDRYDEKQEEFRKVQGQLSYFRDRNQNIISATAQNQLDRLEADYNFAFNIFTEMAKQLEQAKLQVAKDTPAFSVIEPVTIPTSKSAPNQIIIVIAFTIIGMILALSYIFAVEFIKGLKEKLNYN